MSSRNSRHRALARRFERERAERTAAAKAKQAAKQAQSVGGLPPETTPPNHR